LTIVKYLFEFIYKSKVVRIKTGVPGLDEILQGGLIPNRVYLVGGSPGAGKTTFGIQFLVQGAKLGENGLYVSLIDDPQNIIADMSNFSLKLPKFVSSGKISFIDFGKSLLEIADFPTVTQLFSKIRDITNLKNIKRVVVDSISAVRFASVDPFYERKQLAEFVRSLESLGCTTILLSELSDPNKFAPEHFLTHGVIFLHNFLSKGNMIRAIQILKMRGTNHDCNLRELIFTKTGLKVGKEIKI